jgi:trans-2,3-dihydro-3-hydroxyanthranilate isomerase
VHILQQTGAGVLPVEIRFKDGRPQRVTMTQKEAQFKPLKVKKAALAAALGLSLKDFDSTLEPTCVSTGVFNLMVPLRDRAALGKIEMNMSELRRLLGKNATMAYCFALGKNNTAFSRGMLPWELYEDAATGSAAGSLGAYLVKNGELNTGQTLSILQGAEMDRPSHIEVEVSQAGKKLVPRVSGAAVRVFEGTIE